MIKLIIKIVKITKFFFRELLKRSGPNRRVGPMSDHVRWV